MNILFIDESNTPLALNKITENNSFFILSGLVIPEEHWKELNNDFKTILNRYDIRGEIKWRFFAPHKEKAVVEFGKYKYLWGFDSELCLFEVETNNKQTFSNRGILNSAGAEVIRPYTYTNIYGFYGKGTSYVKVEKEDKVILIEKSDLPL